MKKTLFLAALSAMFIFAGSVSAFSGSGSGTVDNPYLIVNVGQLQEMKNNLHAWYELGNDIDASETLNWNDGAGFAPIGDDLHSFTGHFEGRNFTISNLYINRNSTEYVGLFSIIDRGEVRNVQLVDANITGQSYVGILTGKGSYATVTYCHLTGNINGGYSAGGLIGYDSYGITISCDFNGSVTGSNVIGGLIGYSDYGTITDCNSAGSITGYSETGGLVGCHNGNDITNCNFTGEINGGSSAGGLIGYHGNGNVTDCHSTGNVYGSYSNIGGLIGNIYSGVITNSYCAGNVSGESYVGGLAGSAYYGSVTIDSCHFVGNVSGTNDYIGGLVGYIYSGVITNSYCAGNVSGHNQVGGFVGYNCYGAIIDCYLSDSIIIAGIELVGGMAGENTGTINRCYSPENVTVIGTDSVGGLVGYNAEYASVSECFSKATVDANGSDVGGLVGMNYNSSNISNCFATGDVTAENFVGGLVGSNINSAITNCYSAGFVNAPYNVGGLAGYNNSTCDGSFWDTETSGQDTSGCGEPKTTEEMMQQATFVNWNFDVIWGIDEGLTYPYLFALVSRCGDLKHPYPIGDFDQNCMVDFADFAAFSLHWLECTRPSCD